MGTRYGLGIAVRYESGHRVLEHGGAVSGFTAENLIFPDDHIAVAVLTNEMPADAASQIAHKIADLLFSEHQTLDDKENNTPRRYWANCSGRVSTARCFTANANSYFTEQALQGFFDESGAFGPASGICANGKRKTAVG